MEPGRPSGRFLTSFYSGGSCNCSAETRSASEDEASCSPRLCRPHTVPATDSERVEGPQTPACQRWARRDRLVLPLQVLETRSEPRLLSHERRSRSLFRARTGGSSTSAVSLSSGNTLGKQDGAITAPRTPTPTDG